MANHYLHTNFLILYGIVLLAIIARYGYTTDQQRIKTLQKLRLESQQFDLPNHRLRSSDTANSTNITDQIGSHLRNQDFRSVLELIEKRLDQHPENATLYFYAGALSERLGKWSDAERYLQKVRMNSTMFYKQSTQEISPYLPRTE